VFLEQKFYELNAVALDIINAIHGIQIGYLNGNMEYPYSDIDILMYNYVNLFNRINKKKNSMINRIINRIDIKRNLCFERISLIDERQILMRASEKTLFYIYSNIDKYIPSDDESVSRISNKLYPIIKDLDMDTIVAIYHRFKNSVENDIDKDNKLSHLQCMFMGYVMYKVRIHNDDKKVSKLTYEEACRYILNEDVLDVSRKFRKTKIVS